MKLKRLEWKMWKIPAANCAILIIFILVSLCKYSQSQERTLFWGMQAQRLSILFIGEGDPDIWVPIVRHGGTLNSRYKSINITQHRIGAIAADYNFIREVFVFDRVYNRIHLFPTSRDVYSMKGVYGGTSYQFADMSLDWVSRNLYYTDGDIIGIYSNRTGKSQILIEGLSSPFGIASDPLHGYLFWTEIGTQRIRRSNADGSNIISLLENINQPKQLIADHRDQFIYWINGFSNQVERVDYNGTNHSVVTPPLTSDERVTALEIYKDYLFVAVDAWLMPTLTIYSKTGEHVTYLTHTTSILIGNQLGISMASPENQPVVSSPCKTSNGGCDHICIHDDVHGMACLCDYGFTLNQDGRTCGTRTVTQNFLLVTDSLADKLYQINLETEEIHAIIQNASSTGVRRPEAVTYDPLDQTMYWTDRGSPFNQESIRRIRSKNLVSGLEGVLWELEEGGSTQGLAIDISGRALYYTENTLDRLMRVHLGTKTATIFLQLAATHTPLGVLIHQTDKRLYWTNWGSNPTIEKINIPSGTGQTTLVSSNMITPSGLALDVPASKLYWVDHKLNRLERINLDGTDRELLLDFVPHLQVLDIFLVSNVMYASAVGQILRVDTDDLTIDRLGQPMFSNLFGIFAHTEGTFTPDPGITGRIPTAKTTSSTKLPTTTVGSTNKTSIMTFSSATTTTSATTTNGNQVSGEPSGVNLTMVIIVAITVVGVLMAVTPVAVVCVHKHKRRNPSADQTVPPPSSNLPTIQYKSRQKTETIKMITVVELK